MVIGRGKGPDGLLVFLDRGEGGGGKRMEARDKGGTAIRENGWSRLGQVYGKIVTALLFGRREKMVRELDTVRYCLSVYGRHVKKRGKRREFVVKS